MEAAIKSKQIIGGQEASQAALEDALCKYIGRIAHEVNRGYCAALGDHSQAAWEDAPDWQRDSATLGVRLHLSDPSAGPQASHESWMAQKIADGWKWGPEKRPSIKTHPCLVPFDKLPVEQQAKDFIFRAVVLAIANAPDLDVDGTLHDAAQELQAAEDSRAAGGVNA